MLITHKCPTCGGPLLFPVEALGTVGELYGQWLNDIEAEGRSRFYITQLKQRFKDYIIPAVGHIRPEDIKTKDLITLKRELLKTRSTKTTRHILDALKRFLNHLAETGELDHIPKFPRVLVRPAREKFWLDDITQRRILAVAYPDEKLIFRTIIETGERVSEVCAHQAGDLVDGRIRVCRAFDDYGALKTTKTGTDDLRPLSPGLWSAIEGVSCRVNNPASFLFTVGGKPFSRRKLRYRWLRACQRAGVTAIPLSQASRHSKASQVREAASERMREEVRSALGHTSAKTTLKHYALPAGRKIGL
jgi:integrase